MAAERHARINTKTASEVLDFHRCDALLELHFVYLYRPTAQRLSPLWRLEVVSVVRGLADLYALVRQRHGEVVHRQLTRPLALLARLARAQPTHLLRVLGHVEDEALRGQRDETQPDAHTQWEGAERGRRTNDAVSMWLQWRGWLSSAWRVG